MANVVNRTTLEYRPSVNTPDFPTAEWLINPTGIELVDTVPRQHLKVVGSAIVEMSAAEKTAVDAAAATATVDAMKQEALALLSGDSAIKRLLVALSVVNKRELSNIKKGTPRPAKTIDELATEAAQVILTEVKE